MGTTVGAIELFGPPDTEAGLLHVGQAGPAAAVSARKKDTVCQRLGPDSD